MKFSLTARDQFALEAMKIYLARTSFMSDIVDAGMARIASECYALADAMCAEKAKRDAGK